MDIIDLLCSKTFNSKSDIHKIVMYILVPLQSFPFFFFLDTGPILDQHTVPMNTCMTTCMERHWGQVLGKLGGRQ